MVFTTRFVSGSIFEMVPSPVFGIQTAPSPTTGVAGRAPTTMLARTGPLTGGFDGWASRLQAARIIAEMRQTIRTNGRLDSEVRPLHIGALEQGLRGPFLHDPPRLEDVAAVRHLQRPRRVLLDEEDRGALLVDLHDYLEDRVDQDRRQTQGWLVEEEKFWARHEGAANRQHLLFAPRECSGNLVTPLLEAWKEVEDPLFVAADGGGILAHVGAEKKIVAYRHAGEDAASLWCVANAAHHHAIGPQPRDLGTAEPNVATRRFGQARDGAQGGGLTGPVAADYGDDFPFHTAHGEVAQCLDAT